MSKKKKTWNRVDLQNRPNNNNNRTLCKRKTKIQFIHDIKTHQPEGEAEIKDKSYNKYMT